MRRCAIVKVIGIRYLRDLYKGSFTVKQRPAPCPHVPSVKGGWPHMANPLPTGRGGKAGQRGRTSLGDRLNKEKDVRTQQVSSQVILGLC